MPSLRLRHLHFGALGLEAWEGVELEYGGLLTGGNPWDLILA